MNHDFLVKKINNRTNLSSGRMKMILYFALVDCYTDRLRTEKTTNIFEKISNERNDSCGKTFFPRETLVANTAHENSHFSMNYTSVKNTNETDSSNFLHQNSSERERETKTDRQKQREK